MLIIDDIYSKWKNQEVEIMLGLKKDFTKENNFLFNKKNGISTCWIEGDVKLRDIPGYKTKTSNYSYQTFMVFFKGYEIVSRDTLYNFYQNKNLTRKNTFIAANLNFFLTYEKEIREYLKNYNEFIIYHIEGFEFECTN